MYIIGIKEIKKVSHRKRKTVGGTFRKLVPPLQNFALFMVNFIYFTIYGEVYKNIGMTINIYGINIKKH